MKGIKMIIGIDPDLASIQSLFSIFSASLLSISSASLQHLFSISSASLQHPSSIPSQHLFSIPSQMAMPLQDLGDLPFLHRL